MSPPCIPEELGRFLKCGGRQNACGVGGLWGGAPHPSEYGQNQAAPEDKGLVAPPPSSPELVDVESGCMLSHHCPLHQTHQKQNKARHSVATDSGIGLVFRE